MCRHASEIAMCRLWNLVRGVFWLLVALLVFVVFLVVYGLLSVFDDVCGWINRKFDELYGNW